MPYRDREQQRVYMRVWRATHPERLRCHRRAEVLQSAFQRGRLPSARVVERHGFTREELRPLVSRMLVLRGLDVKQAQYTHNHKHPGCRALDTKPDTNLIQSHR